MEIIPRNFRSCSSWDTAFVSYAFWHSHTLLQKWISEWTLADLSNYQPIQFQPVGLCKESTGNQPCSNPHRGKRLVFVKSTVIPTMCFKIQRLERGWFSQNLPSAFLYEGWNTVDFPETNRHSNRGYSCMMVGNRLVLGWFFAHSN